MKIAKKIWDYLPWAIMQQYAVVSLFVFLSVKMNSFWAATIAVIIFSALHFPNKFLMVLALSIEMVFMIFYKNIFSIAWMGIYHAIIAVMAKEYLPFSITKGMKVLWEYKNKE